MGGLFTEMGPWRVNEEDPKEVGHNAHTWCGPANMIYLESPIGVGFSYTTESDFGRNVKVNDRFEFGTSLDMRSYMLDEVVRKDKANIKEKQV